ncbi:hypothetical protein N7513_008985 [Penicillium frequentans]|nr:hypothetical protein N7513_008985 [Penicillium glabrum]
MSDTEQYTSPAAIFLQEEVSRLGTSPGLRALPAGPIRDLIVFSWGPLIYRTCYTPETKHIIPIFLRCLNNAVSKSLGQTLTGSKEELDALVKSYSSKIFTAHAKYNGLDEDGVRRAFHDYKVSLFLPSTELPSRLRVCLMIDDQVLANLKAILESCAMSEKSVDLGRCWVKLVEENYPDSRCWQETCPAQSSQFDHTGEYRGNYRGWTMVALPALLEVFDGLRQLKRLVEYHREGRVYLGKGKWSSM